MKNIIIILCLVVLTNSFGQKSTKTLSKIDQKYGLNKFKLGAAVSSFTNLSLVSKEGKLIEYNYIGKDIKTFMNHETVQIRLQFYDNKLYTISIRVGIDKDLKYENEERELLRKVELNYGNYNFVPGESSRIIEDKKYNKNSQYSWIGNKCELFMDTYILDLSYLGTDRIYDHYLEFWTKSKLIDKKIAKEDL